MHNADRLALDRSVRVYDQKSGHLHVQMANISKANVCPYFGREIPDAERLGLDPDRIYQLLRDPAEMARAASTFSGKPILLLHRPQTADDHNRDITVGSVGEAQFDAPYLQAPLTIWDGPAIAAIESGAQRELSCGYYYRADMTPGEYQGERYDGRMVDITGNHVALVEAGRAGPDVFIGDEALTITFPELENEGMAPKPLSRQALMASGALHAYLRPKLAADAKLDLHPMLKDVTAKNWSASKGKIKTALDKALKGKLAADADLEDVVELLDKLEDCPEIEQVADEEETEEERKRRTDERDPVADADPEMASKLTEVLAAEGMPEDKVAAIIAKVCGGSAQPASDEGEEMPKAGKPEGVSKAAMDAAIAAATAATEKRVMLRQAAIREAEKAVRPYIGDIALAQDSADAVYRLALDHLGVEIAGVHPSAYPAILKAQPKPGADIARRTHGIGMDAATSAEYAKRFPDANRLKI